MIINKSRVTIFLTFALNLIQLLGIIYTYNLIEYLLTEKKNIQRNPPLTIRNEVEQGESIRSIMARTGTDKLTRHAYDRYYDFYFHNFRDKKDLTILEIGAHTGLSLLLWSEYFSKSAIIHGISYAIDEKASKELVCKSNPDMCENIEIFNGDQGDPQFLESLCQKYKYDIIVDDGSHLPAHQILSLQYLFSALKPGGLYVIEDLETSYWDVPDTNLYGYDINAGIGSSPKISAVEKLKQYIDVMMRYDMAYPSLSVSKIDHDFFSITFGEGLAIIRKSSEDRHPNIPVAPVIHSNLEQWILKAKS